MQEDEEQVRPATLEDLKKIIQALNKQGAEYLLIGGYALFAHGYHRATEDIDLLIPARKEVAGPVTSALLVLSDREAENLPPEWFEEGENIRLIDEIVVDLLFKTCGETYETLAPYTETIDLDGIPVRTLTLEGLLKTKQSDREKDIMDRAILERVLSYLNDDDRHP